MKSKKTLDIAFNENKMLLFNKPSFLLQEAYKTLRTNITFSLPGTGCKCIGIVSSNRGDGKSFIASNLAVSLAQINKRVILIDCDLRLPTISQKFAVRPVPGLSNYLSGDVTKVPVIRHEKAGIDIIPSGNIPPDSTALICSQEMMNLIEKLKEDYDFIIFDFPPINIVSDAVLLSGIIDGYLVIIRHKKSEYHTVGSTIRQMRLADANIIGLVYNGKSDEKSYYKRNKGYYSDNYYKKPD